MRLSKEGSQHISEAVLLTRKMRHAAISATTEQDQQQPLKDAELLGMPTVRFVLKPSDSERSDLVHTLTQLRERYERFSPYGGVSLDFAVGFLKNQPALMRFDSLDWYRQRFERVNDIPRGNLLSNQFGIIAPLSSDFFFALLAKEFLARETDDEVFDVKPAATGASSAEVILPKNEKGQHAFELKEEIGIFLDVRGEGNTLGLLSPAVKEAYPGKTIYHYKNKDVRPLGDFSL